MKKKKKRGNVEHLADATTKINEEVLWRETRTIGWLGLKRSYWPMKPSSDGVEQGGAVLAIGLVHLLESRHHTAVEVAPATPRMRHL